MKENTLNSKEMNIAFANIDFFYQDEITQDCVIVTKSNNRRLITLKSYNRLCREYPEWCSAKDSGNKTK